MKYFRDFAFAVQPCKDRWFVRSAGSCFLGTDYREPVKIARFAEIFWCIDGKAEFLEQDGTAFTLEPGSFWYYPPDSTHRLRILPPFFRYCWLSLEGPGIGALFRGLAIHPGINYAGDCPTDQFEEIMRDLPDGRDAVRRKVLADAVRLLVLATDTAASKRSAPVEDARNRIDNQFRNTTLTVESLAESLHMHRVSLSRAFSAHFGMTVCTYLNSKRVRCAVELLRTTELPLEEIALRSGFASADYLSKVLRKTMSMTAREIRNSALRE